MNIILFTADEISQPLPAADERARHIRTVLHKGTGDSFEAGIINGPAGSAQITGFNEKNLFFTFTPSGESDPLFPLSLIIGFPRPIQLKRLLRSVSSLGVAEVHLTATELGEKSYLQSALAERPKALAALTDGAVQAKSTRIPALFFHDSVSSCARAFSGRPFGARIMLDTASPAFALSDAVRQNAYAGKNVVAAVGSERGWTETERAVLRQAGFAGCTLGRRILRTETAAVAAAVLILAAMEKV